MDTQAEEQTDNLDEFEVNEKAMRRVRGLLAKAEDTDFPEEAEALTAKAIELMAEHGINRRMLDAKYKVERIMKRHYITVTGAYMPQLRTLLGQLATAMGVYCTYNVDPAMQKQYRDDYREWLYGGGYGKKPIAPPRNYVSLYGFDTDIERVEMLFTSLSLQSVVALKKTVKPDWFSGTTRSWKTSYFTGWVYRVAQRVKEAEQGAVEEVESSTALVLVNPYAQAEQFALGELGRKPKKGFTPTVRSATAFHEGQDEAERADIGQDRIENDRTKALTG